MQFTPLKFEKPTDRPFLFTSFVSSIDGKIIVKEKGYWPIGSKKDYEYFTYLRAHADAIVDAKNTALQFGKFTIRTIHDEMYQGFRKELGKSGVPEFIVLTSNPDEDLGSKMRNDLGYKPTLMTNSEAQISDSVNEVFNIERVTNGSKHVQIIDLITYLNSKNYQNVFIDGGPSLIAQLLQETVLDEVHLTIAPKIFGSIPGKTLTMTEGILFPPEAVPQFKLLSVEKLEDEVVLRYKRS